MFKSPLESALSLLTIENCLICNAAGEQLCEGCFAASFDTLESRCYICNKLTAQNRVCKSCKSRSRLRRVWWLSGYSGVYKDLVWQVKYQRKRATARLLGRYLADTLPFLPPETLVVPLSTATSRIRRRGYDQAVMMAAAFARARDLSVVPALIRTDQKELIGMRRNDRLKAMEDSLALKSGVDLKNKSILLIDDVLTTGASLEAAAKLLRKNGAAHVDAAVICRKAPV